jgi:cytidylate kinase
MNEQPSPHQQPKLVAAAERQMQAWTRIHESEDRAVRPRDLLGANRQIGSFITISRQAGVGASEIARLAGDKLGWEVLDKGLLDRMADRFHLSRMMLDLVDETQSNWVYDVLGSWMDRKIIPHEKYVYYLTRLVIAAARRGNCIFVGRGARFILPPEKGLAVRLIASRQYRLEHVVSQQGLSKADAEKWLTQTDLGRRELVRRFFHHDVDDPQLYDLVLNVERFSTESAADLIVAAVVRKVPDLHALPV